MRIESNKWKYKKPAKAILGIAGAIFLGAVGSGVWEAFLKPISSTTRDVMLNIVSLGITFIREDIYKSIAEGLHEASSLSLLTYFVLVSVYFIMFLSFFIFEKSKELVTKQFNLLTKINKILGIDNDESPNEDEAHDNLLKLQERLASLQEGYKFGSNKFISALSYSAITLILVIAVGIIFDCVKISYINAAVTHFKQIYTISAPFLTATEKEEILSKFAQVRSQKDYEKICQKLEQIAKTNNQIVPKFSTW